MKLFSKLSVKLQLTILCFLIATLSVGIFAAIIFTLSAAVVIQLAERNANQAIVFATKYLYTRIEDINANMIAFQAKEAVNHSVASCLIYQAAGSDTEIQHRFKRHHIISGQHYACRNGKGIFMLRQSYYQ